MRGSLKMPKFHFLGGFTFVPSEAPALGASATTSGVFGLLHFENMRSPNQKVSERMGEENKCGEGFLKKESICTRIVDVGN